MWLAQFTARVLIPGGSLICFTGQARLNRDMPLFDQHLRYWWLLNMLHTQSTRLHGKDVIINTKPVLWYVKDHRRQTMTAGPLLSDLLRPPARDNLLHDWGQGDGGIQPVIEHLTDPGELVVDPFAGSATWGRLVHSLGRRWIGADVVEGGATRITA